MTTAIQLNHQFGTKALEICYIAINTFLTLKTNRVVFQKEIPQFSFPWGHIFTELAGVFFVVWIVFHILPPALTGHPPHKCGGQGGYLTCPLQISVVLPNLVNLPGSQQVINT